MVVLSQDGSLVGNIPKSNQKTVGIEFLKDERILIVLKNGQYILYNPYQEIKDSQARLLEQGLTNEIPYRVFFDPKSSPQNKEYEIKFIQTNGESFIFVTQANFIFLVYDIDKENPQRKLISFDGKNFQLNFKEFSRQMISYYLDFDKVTYVIYLACLDKGLLKVKFNKQLNTVVTERIAMEIVGKPLEIVLSPSEDKKRMMAVISGKESKEGDLGSGYDFATISVLEINENIVENYHVSQLTLSSEEKNEYQGLYWFGKKAVVIGFRKTFKIFTTKDLFQMNSKDGLTRGRFRLFFCSEIDGLRIMAVNSNNQAFIYMIRNTPIEYVYVKQ